MWRPNETRRRTLERTRTHHPPSPPPRPGARAAEARQAGTTPAAAAALLLLGLLAALLLAAPLGALSASGDQVSPDQTSTDRRPAGVPSLRLVTRDGALVLERPEGDAVDSRAAMERWHRRWRRRVEPVHQAAEELQSALGHRRWRPVRGECRDLARALQKMEPEEVLPAPNYAVHRHLERYLRHLIRAVVACLGGRPTAVDPELRKARKARYHASLVLRRWDLTP